MRFHLLLMKRSNVSIYEIYLFFGVAIVFGQAYPFKGLIQFCPFAYANSQVPSLRGESGRRWDLDLHRQGISKQCNPLGFHRPFNRRYISNTKKKRIIRKDLRTTNYYPVSNKRCRLILGLLLYIFCSQEPIVLHITFKPNILG